MTAHQPSPTVLIAGGGVAALEALLALRAAAGERAARQGARARHRLRPARERGPRAVRARAHAPHPAAGDRREPVRRARPGPAGGGRRRAPRRHDGRRRGAGLRRAADRPGRSRRGGVPGRRDLRRAAGPRRARRRARRGRARGHREHRLRRPVRARRGRCRCTSSRCSRARTCATTRPARGHLDRDPGGAPAGGVRQGRLRRPRGAPAGRGHRRCTRSRGCARTPTASWRSRAAGA